MRISRAALAAPADGLRAMERFYLGTLGLRGAGGEGRLEVAVGPARLEFEAVAGAPFYHFALLVPGNRFAAARTWLESRAALLTRPGEVEPVFDFEFWDARACYAHDPAGNIVELIAHRGVAQASGAEGDFAGSELRAISEVGLVLDDTARAARLLESAHLPLWFGDVGRPDALGFVGRQAHTLILCTAHHPWLPTGRPAEAHPARITLAVSGAPTAILDLAPTISVEVGAVR